MRRPGFIMIVALVFALVLAVMVMAMAYFISSETRGVGFQLDETKMLYLAQAGVERGFREIRDDYLTGTQQGTADLRGADTTDSVSVSSATRMCYIDDSSAKINSATDQAIIRTFDSNYTQAKIISVFLFVRASGEEATIVASYTTDGSTYTTAFTQELPDSDTLADYSANITGSLTWTTIMSPNFRLRVQRTEGNENVNIDAIWLRVTYKIDTNTELWFTGTYDTFPKTLGDGFIQSVSIADEAGKVHLNYASQSLLSFLMQERGVAAGTANTLATAIVNYRGALLTNPFDSVEELQQVTGMTSVIYDLIKNYVTVYSFINTNSYRPPASGATPRSPININTAPREVLEAIFDPYVGAGLDASDVPALATDIITQRATTPFTCFYHSDGTVTSDLYDFIRSRAYLSTSGNPDQQDRVLDTVDASSLVPVNGSTGVTNLTTEFCYANTTYKIDSVGRINLRVNPTNPADVEFMDLRVQTVIGNDGSRVFPTYAGDTVLTGYWKEIYQ